MSLVVALPCAEGIVLASDSRAIVGRNTRVDLGPKTEVIGNFGVAISGEVSQTKTGFDVSSPLALFWSSVRYELTEQALQGFLDTLVRHMAEHPPKIFTEEIVDGVSQAVAASLHARWRAQKCSHKA